MNTQTTHLVKITKLPRTYGIAYRAKIRQYLADATEVEDNPEATTAERLAHLVDRFQSEVGEWMSPREGRQAAAKHWLQGLAIDVEYYDSEIPGAVLRIHGIQGAQMSDDLAARTVDYWWDHLAAHVVRLQDDKEAGRPLI